MKTFYEMYGVGTSKYSVHFHDGVKTHKDGSPFFDIQLFRNKRKKDRFIKGLVKEGAVAR